MHEIKLSQEDLTKAILAYMVWRLERLEQDGGPVVLDNLSPPLPQYLAYYNLQAVVEASPDNLDAFRFLQAVLKRLGPNFTTLADSLPDELRPFFEEQLELLNSWARDVASGALPEPRRTGRPSEATRNAVICETIQWLHDHTSLPYMSSDGLPNACQAIADRLGLSYEAVRSVRKVTKS